MTSSAGSGLRAQRARVVDEQVEPARARATASTSAARCAGSVTSPGIATTVGVRRELGGRGGEPVGAAGVDDERPAPVGELGGERPAEALRRSGDQCDCVVQRCSWLPSSFLW